MFSFWRNLVLISFYIGWCALGIDICKKNNVTLNDNHELRLVTSIHKNPVTTIKKSPSLKNKITVQCVYRRTKDGDYERDGNPFIYALKNYKYSITNAELYKFKFSFDIITTSIATTNSPTYIVGMPSSHNIVSHFGRRIARKCNAIYINDFFVKQTVGNILDTFQHDEVKSPHKKSVNRILATYEKLPAHEEISLKKIENKVRHYFTPLTLNPSYTGPALSDSKVVLVDDLLSTGTTLLHAEKILSDQGVSVGGAFCLLSDL